MPRARPHDPVTSELARLGRAWLAAESEACSRAWEIGWRHLASGGAVASPAGARRYLAEMATVPWLALGRLGADLRRGDAAGAPVGDRRVLGRPVTVPVRVERATQGFALYAVPAAPVVSDLRARGDHFRAVDLGGQRTAAALSGVRYEASGLGAYDEVYLAYLVAPREAPTALGLYLAACPVSDRFAAEAGRALWGYPKTVETVTVALHAQAVTWRVGASRGDAVALTFARGGAGASTGVPVPSYSVLDGRPRVATLTRTGRDERVRGDGAGVTVTLAGGSGRSGLALAVRRLGLAGSRPFLSVWTERMSGAFGAPGPPP